MDLFNQDALLNLLPYDGVVHYYGQVLNHQQASFYFDRLLHGIAWKQDEAVVFGKHILTKRKVAWYGDLPFQYTYSKITREALMWTPELLELKQLAESRTAATYNSCLLNLYHDGTEGVAWHSDDEKTLARNGAIASLSFGAARKFAFRHKKTKQTTSILLENGSLLVMKGTAQTNWLHTIPKTKTVSKPRISLTFRTIIL